MRKMLSLLVSLFFLSIASTAFAADSDVSVRGVYLLTDYPAVTLRPGTTSTIPLRLSNHGTAPARLDLAVEGVPQGWKAAILGGGQPVAAAMPPVDGSVSLQLRLDVPADAGAQPHTLTVSAQGPGQRLSLPIEIALSKELPARLSVETKLPALKGSAQSSFDYQFTIKNDSGKDLLVSMSAQAPRFFETSFTESYGSQQLSSVPIKAGESKDVKLGVRPPNTAEPGSYPITVAVSAGDANASTKLSLDIIGQPRLGLAGRNGLMSASAEISKATSVPIILTNSGGAPADGVKLSGTAPSGWQVEFDPPTIDHIAAGQTAETQVRITPSAESLAGDYMVRLQATSQGQSVNENLRVSVTTSSMWGITGALILAIAVLIMVGAVARYGRR